MSFQIPDTDSSESCLADRNARGAVLGVFRIRLDNARKNRRNYPGREPQFTNL